MRWLRRSAPSINLPPAAGTAADGPNHVIAARHEFANAFGDLARGKRNWQVVAFALLGLLAAMTAAYIRLASSARLVPYVVQVDRLGQVLGAGLADPLARPDQRLITSQLAQFVRNIRTVLPAEAAVAQAELLRRSYTVLGPEAAAFLNDYFSRPGNDPRLLGARLTRQVEVTSILRVPNSDTWKLRWSEDERPLQAGTLPRTAGWEGYITVKLVPPASADAVEDNPLGLYITSITWTEIARTPADVPLVGGGRP